MQSLRCLADLLDNYACLGNVLELYGPVDCDEFAEIVRDMPDLSFKLGHTLSETSAITLWSNRIADRSTKLGLAAVGENIDRQLAWISGDQWHKLEEDPVICNLFSRLISYTRQVLRLIENFCGYHLLDISIRSEVAQTQIRALEVLVKLAIRFLRLTTISTLRQQTTAAIALLRDRQMTDYTNDERNSTTLWSQRAAVCFGENRVTSAGREYLIDGPRLYNHTEACKSPIIQLCDLCPCVRDLFRTLHSKRQLL